MMYEKFSMGSVSAEADHNFFNSVSLKAFLVTWTIVRFSKCEVVLTCINTTGITQKMS